jgi:hypothetical protein
VLEIGQYGSKQIQDFMLILDLKERFRKVHKKGYTINKGFLRFGNFLVKNSFSGIFLELYSSMFLQI